MIARILWIAGFLLIAALSVRAEDVPPPADPAIRHYLTIPEGRLADFVQRPPMAVPMVSFHRGGPHPGYPENAVETMDRALAYGYGFMEVDVAQLADGTLILMHDNSIDRTTTGTGAVADLTWEQVKGLQLKDNKGSVTDFRVPRLETVLRWAVGRTILTLDIKRGVDFAAVAKLVEETGAGDYAAAIAYSLEQAQAFHRAAPNMPLSISFSSPTDIEAFDASGIPDHLVFAWTGTRLREPSLYRALQARGWRVFVGTLGRAPRSLDHQIMTGAATVSYRDIVAMGADVIATDRFWAVQAEIGNPQLYIFTRRLANAP